MVVTQVEASWVKVGDILILGGHEHRVNKVDRGFFYMTFWFDDDYPQDVNRPPLKVWKRITMTLKGGG